MNAEQIAQHYAGHPFVDYFDCLTEALRAAKRRNKLAVQAKRAGKYQEAARHLHMRRHYMRRVRQWHDMIDWSEE